MPGCRPAARHPVLAAPADQADDNGRASTRHAGQSTPAMPMHWTSRMALPHRGVQRRRPAAGQRPAATSPAASAEEVPGVLPRQQIPAFPVTGPVAGTVPARAPQAIPGATGHDRDRHQPADSFPAAPGHRLQAQPARDHRPAPAASERQNARIWAVPITAPRIRAGRQATAGIHRGPSAACRLTLAGFRCRGLLWRPCPAGFLDRARQAGAVAGRIGRDRVPGVPEDLGRRCRL